jgi:prepilin-type N-terminal cleavage/methylation domain-containing protein
LHPLLRDSGRLGAPFAGGEHKGPIFVLKHLQDRRGADRSMLERGFTLVELLVVIVILGILAAVVVFAVGGTTENAQKNACKAELNTVESAVEAFNASEGVYPTNAGQLVNPPPDSDGNPVGRFLRSEPKWHTVTGSAVNPGPKCAPYEP